MCGLFHEYEQWCPFLVVVFAHASVEVLNTVSASQYMGYQLVGTGALLNAHTLCARIIIMLSTFSCLTVSMV